MSLDVLRFKDRFIKHAHLTPEGRQFIEAFNMQLLPEQVEYFGSQDEMKTKSLEDIDKQEGEIPIWDQTIFEEVLAYVALNNKQTRCGKAILEHVARFEKEFDGYNYCFDYYLFLNRFYRIPVKLCELESL